MLHPTRGKLLVEQEEAEDRTKGGIILPDMAKKEQAFGKVLAVGIPNNDHQGKPIDPLVRKGDRIAFGKYSGVKVEDDGKEYLIINHDDVMAIAK